MLRLGVNHFQTVLVFVFIYLKHFHVLMLKKKTGRVCDAAAPHTGVYSQKYCGSAQHVSAKPKREGLHYDWREKTIGGRKQSNICIV